MPDAQNTYGRNSILEKVKSVNKTVNKQSSDCLRHYNWIQ